jgi:WD40 repeat protein
MRALLLGKVKAIASALVVLAVFATALAQSGAKPVAPGPDPRQETLSERPRPARVAEPPGQRDLKLPEHARARLGTARLWHESFVSGVAFAPDGQTLASSSWDRTVRFWDTATGEPSLKFPTLQEPDGALSLAYSPDGTKLAIGHAAGWVRLRDLAATRELLRAKVHSEDVQSVAFAPDGRAFATSGYQAPIVCIRDSETGRERHKLAFKENPTFQGQLAFPREGKRLALGATSRINDGERIVIWDLDKRDDPIIIRKAHDGGLKSLVFTPEGALISCGVALERVRRPNENEIHLESSPQIRIWDAAPGQKLRELDPGVARGHCTSVLSSDGKTLVSLHVDRMLVWDLASGKIRRRIDTGVDAKNFGRSVGIAISPDGTTIAAERHDYMVHLWDL